MANICLTLYTNGFLLQSSSHLPRWVRSVYITRSWISHAWSPLIRHHDPPWPYGWEDCSHFCIRPDQCNLVSFLLQRKIIISACPARPASKRQLWVGWGGGEMQTPGQRDSHPSPFCCFSHLWKDDIFSLFSKIFQHLAHLNGWSSSPYSSAPFELRCSLTVCLLTLYSTKNSSNGTKTYILKFLFSEEDPRIIQKDLLGSKLPVGLNQYTHC